MLSDVQIEALFKFCKRKYVYYYDVQVELVDHLANAIEIEMENDRKLSFENALQKVYSGFGIMGFSTLVAEKERQAEKYNRRLYWRLFKSQFGWPQIIGFIAINVLLFSVITTFALGLILSCLAAFLLTIPLYSIKLFRFRKLAGKTQKKFVILNLSTLGGFGIVPWYILQTYLISEEHFNLNYIIDFKLAIVFSLSLSLYIISSIAISLTIDAAKKSLTESFPEVFKFA